MGNSIDGINRASIETINRVLDKLSEKPIIIAGDIAKWTGYTTPGAYKVIDRMVELGLLLPYGDESEQIKHWISKDYNDQLESDAGKVSDSTINLVGMSYDRNGCSTATDEYGMREMQRRAFAKRNEDHLLIKAPPASGKSRALMFIALDKLINQGRRKVIIAVPERSIGASFSDTDLTSNGFFADWHVDDRNNLCTDDGLTDQSKVTSFMRFMDGDDQILLCTHATLRFAFEQVDVNKLNGCVLAIDEFHHVSTSDSSRLGELLHEVMSQTNVQVVAMTGSYFRGDAVPILTAEDEAMFAKVTYTYYEQLNGYKYLKTLGIGYSFYTGSYLDPGVLEDVLNINKKTIIHIPNVNSKESSQRKLEEVDRIYDVLGSLEGHEDDTGVDLVRANNGRLLRIANLVDDDPNHRKKITRYLAEHARNDISAIDFIVALGMAKEGFDWPYCEYALTIGYRSSLTEIVQIIGRCTRDSYNKTHAQFTNLIVEPAGTNDEITVSVNNMLKAITVSLLMEQVLAPTFKFTPRPSDGRKPQPGEIFVKGLRKPTSERVKNILENDLEDLTASVLQDEKVQRAAAQGVTGDYVKHLQSKIIRERHPGLSDEEVEITRQYLALNLASKTAKPIKDESGDTRFIKFANRFVKVDELDINLIDSINPFHGAFEVMSKKIGSDTFKIIQDTIAGSRIDMKVDDALVLVEPLKAFIVAHNGKYPSLHSSDRNEQLLAQAQAFLTAQRAKWERERSADAEFGKGGK